jgi:hypothetical protein
MSANRGVRPGLQPAAAPARWFPELPRLEEAKTVEGGDTKFSVDP